MGVDTAAVDRLPWLGDELREQPITRRRAGPLVWGAVVAAAVAVGAVWMDAKGLLPSTGSSRQGPSTTVLLPPLQAPAKTPVAAAIRPAKVRPALPQKPQMHAIAREPSTPMHVQAPVAAAIRPAKVRPSIPQKPQKPQMHAIAKEPSTPMLAAPRAAIHESAKPKHSAPVPHSAGRTAASKKPSSKAAAAAPAGRVIEIGAFGSTEQANRAWSSTLSAHPALGDLPAKVTEDRNSKGQTFYRMRVRTTSQAHSEVLCQRMRAIKLSCAVMGLPGKAKVER